MIFIYHRVNTLEELSKVPFDSGAEIDIRYHNDDLILHHDPFGHHEKRPELLKNFLTEWRHRGPLILNIKTEGIEQRCIDLMNQYQVRSWFFLDLSMPYFVKYANFASAGSVNGLSPENLAVRFSEFEAEDYAMGFAGKAGWMWIDCFNELPVNANKIAYFKSVGFKICIVSPELQGHNLTRITEFKDVLSDGFDAICTKRPDLWI